MERVSDSLGKSNGLDQPAWYSVTFSQVNGIHTGFTKSKSGLRFWNHMDFFTDCETGFAMNRNLDLTDWWEYPFVTTSTCLTTVGTHMPYGITQQRWHSHIYPQPINAGTQCLQCFDAVGWMAVWGNVHICMWPRWCHCQSLSLDPINPDRFYLSGTGSLWYSRTKGP